MAEFVKPVDLGILWDFRNALCDYGTIFLLTYTGALTGSLRVNSQNTCLIMQLVS